MDDQLRLLKVVSKFANTKNRKSAATELAMLLQAEDLIIFVEDPAISELLPGQGFRQTIRNYQAWKSFLDKCKSGECRGTVPHPEEETMINAVGIPVESGVVVLIGENPQHSDLEKIKAISPIIVSLLKEEMISVSTKSIAKTATHESGKVERIAKALDLMRKKINKSYLEISKKNNELIKINNELDNFIYTASHDLRAPVSNIEGLINTLDDILETNKNEEIEAIVKLIRQSTERFRSTISSLTEISKIQNVCEEPEVMSFEEIIEEAKFTLANQIKESRAEIIVDLKIPEIIFSRKNLSSIIYNLISNGIKYCSSDRKPVISVSTEIISNHLLLKITDNGLGIKKENQDKIFSMFKRLHTHVEGTGIGLYIVKKIIDNAEGKIELESQEGQGTTFKIFFNSNTIPGR